jgi:hypothetical protein
MACLLDALENIKRGTLHFTAFAAASGPLCLSRPPGPRAEALGLPADEGVMRAMVAILALSKLPSNQVKSRLTMILKALRGPTALPE